MKISKVKIENGGKGFWILPFLGLDWTQGRKKYLGGLVGYIGWLK